MLVMRFTPFFIASLISVIAATPLPAPPNQPPIPGVQDIKDNHIHVPPDKALFYSGIKGDMPQDHAKANNLQTLRLSWKDKNYLDQFMNREGETRQFFSHASEAMAKSASGKVQVMLPKGALDSGRAGSTWAKHEFPNLKCPGVELHRLDVGPSGQVEGSRQLTNKETGKPSVPLKPASLQGKPFVPSQPASLRSKPVVPDKPAYLQIKGKRK